MRFGFYLPEVGPAATPDNLVTIAQRGDALGYYCLVFGDHLLVPRQSNSYYPFSVDGVNRASPTGEYYEQLTLLTFLAGVTQSIRLVPSVMIVPHRRPIHTAKILATMDVLSKGRIILGVGVGWNREEFEALDLPPFEERGAVTDEYLRVFQELWRSEHPTFAGQYSRFSDFIFLPKPVQQPRIPIWVGGNSKRAIRRAAELGDAWHPIGAIPASPFEPDEMAACIQYLADSARAYGRDPQSIEVAMKVPLYDPGQGGARRRFSGDAEAIAADIRLYRDLGVKVLIFDARGSSLDDSLERLERYAGIFKLV